MASGSDLLQLVNSLGLEIAKSGMFGCENESQGKVFAFHCVTTGQDILTIPQEYHLMNKKLSLRADAMLARLSKHGGSYQIVEHSPNAAEVELEYKGRKIKERLSWEDAKQEPFVYAGKEAEVLAKLASGQAGSLTIKSNYATPRKRMQMLWSRVISDGVRVVAPELVTGSYTPAEIADFAGIDLRSLEDGKASSAPVVMTPAVATPAAVTHGKTVETNRPQSAADQTDPPASEDQAKEIELLFDAMGVSQANREASYKARGAKDAKGLTSSQAVGLIQTLKDRLDKHRETKPSAANATVIDVRGPSTKEQYDLIVAKIKEVAQGPKSELTKRIQAKLVGSKLKIGDLTYDEARILIATLDGLEADAFFEMQLEKAVPAQSDSTAA